MNDTPTPRTDEARRSAAACSLNAAETEALMCMALLSELKMAQWYPVIVKFNELKKDPAPALAAIGRKYSGENPKEQERTASPASECFKI